MAKVGRALEGRFGNVDWGLGSRAGERIGLLGCAGGVTETVLANSPFGGDPLVSGSLILLTSLCVKLTKKRFLK